MATIVPLWDMAAFPYHAPAHQAGEPFRVLSVARLVEKKGLDDGIRAIALARRAHPEIRYDIVGDGPLRGALAALIGALDQGEAITLHGSQSHARVREMMGQAQALLAPSRTAGDGDVEGLGVALLEAQAAGVPVIATRHGPFAGIITPGETGFLAAERTPDELARYLETLIERPELAATISAAGRSSVERRFTPDEITRQTETLYTALIHEWRERKSHA
jgi:colanic acid/amylovoran biosynthesis glycosyltransferase